MEPLIRNISDTALWAASYRARETERPDALFRDPFARRLAGERGEQIAAEMLKGPDTTWAWAMRTYLFDRTIEKRIADGTRLVLNLAAGLDARPYRMNFPSDLRWVEVDLPPLLDYKNEILAGERPHCRLERHGLDLANRPARQALFDQLGGRGMVITEGLLLYLSEEEVADLAADFARSEFDYWAFELCSPALLKFVQSTSGARVAEGGAKFQFAPRTGPLFFEALGWSPVRIDSVGEIAIQLGRLPEEFLKAPPPSPGPDGPIWQGVCLFERSALAK